MVPPEPRPAPDCSRQEFPKSLRLRRRREFLKVQSRGLKVSTEPMLALVLKNELPFTRLGLTVSNKVGSAPVRTRIRRRLRELFRKERARLPVGLDVVLVARSAAAGADYGALQRAFLKVASTLKGRWS